MPESPYPMILIDEALTMIQREVQVLPAAKASVLRQRWAWC